MIPLLSVRLARICIARLFAGRINIARVYLSFAGHALFSDSRMFLECSFRAGEPWRDWGGASGSPA